MMHVMLVTKGRHACRLATCRHQRAGMPTCRHQSTGNPGMMQVVSVAQGRHACRLATCKASKHGKSWNDAGEVGGKGPACREILE